MKALKIEPEEGGNRIGELGNRTGVAMKIESVEIRNRTGVYLIKLYQNWMIKNLILNDGLNLVNITKGCSKSHVSYKCALKNCKWKWIDELLSRVIEG